MAKFFVGQRVRLVDDGSVYRAENRKLIGAEGRIACRSPYAAWEWEVHVNGSVCDVDESCMEPILPAGSSASKYSLTELLDRCRAGEGIAA